MTKEQFFEDLDQKYVGMDNVKAFLRSMACSIEQQLAVGVPSGRIPLNPILLVGNPGVGKTSVALTLAQLYYNYGLIDTPDPIFWHGSSSIFSPSYQETIKAITSARDKKGLLLVDEAHNLDGEFLKAFMACLTDPDHPFAVCFIAYETEKLLSLDPGFYRLLQGNIIHLEDHTPNEMYEIFVRAMTRKGYSADEQTLTLVKELMRREYATRTAYTGNAHYVLRLLDEMCCELNLRCSREGISFGTTESHRFIETDIPESYRRRI